MKLSLQKIHKFFKLEAERGYDNRAVVGGLDRILDSWEAEARADSLPDDIIQAVVSRLRDYPRLSASSRAEALDGLWRRFQRSISGLSLPLPSSYAPEPTPPPDAAAPGVKEQIASSGQAAGRPETREKELSAGNQAGRTQTVSEPAQEGELPASDVDEAPVSEEEFQLNGQENGSSLPEQEEAQEGDDQELAYPARPKGAPVALEAPVTVLPGVGPKHAGTLERLGISVLRDMLYYFPRRYDDYTQLKPINRLQFGEEVTVIGTVQSVHTRPIRSGQAQIVEAVISDGSGALRVTWFNQPWQAKRLKPGTHLSISGKVEQYLGRAVMNSPEWEPLEQQQLSTNRIVPVYPLTAQITQRWLRRTMNSVVNFAAARVQDYLPEKLRRSAGLVPLSTALLQMHFPDSMEKLKAARHRLAFDEIFLLQFGVLRQKRAWKDRNAQQFETPDAWIEAQIAHLPYNLTGAQQRAISDIRADLASGRPMNRLLQGDVGSGKTVVAALAVALVAQSGAQSALMAPTSILAEQHYKNLLKLLHAAGEGPLQESEIRLMVGATPEAEKREIRSGLADGSVKLVIGTHALIEDPVVFSDLELVIVDEQHRFGVEQRAALRSKGSNPHLLVMTATPIPRSLALTVYGDLDLSVMDEMPPGRQPVSTYVLAPRERERAYTLVRSQVEAGRQAFIIYPLVEESEKSEAKAAVEEQARLQAEIFPKLRVGLLHGRMRPEEKDEIMADFRDGKTHVLVSTSVVEVGVDVPNATVMIIEGANRFGLAQLHQFRGRVGRGAEQSYCLLIPDTPDAVENERLQVMAETNDGFVLAERDLDQRGPGQFLGTRQSGFSELQVAKLTDVHLIEKARKHAQTLFEIDPDLVRPEHQFLAGVLQRFWGDGKGDIS